jgi:post-segregation antitoxin (ccd killing protein)
MTQMVTVRIDEQTKRKIKRYGIPVSQVARDAILREIERKEREQTLRAVKRMEEILKKIDINRVVRGIREDRSVR